MSAGAAAQFFLTWRSRETVAWLKLIIGWEGVGVWKGEGIGFGC